MISSVTGTLVALDGGVATVRPQGPLGESLSLEVLLPAYLAERLVTRIGEAVTLATFLYLEGQGQGTSFEPRLLGFASADERKFFDLFTTVKGIGNRKALRAMARTPAEIAGAIVRGDAKALTQLPEIGKKLAETMILELKDKVAAFASADSLDPGRASAVGRRPAAQVEPALTGPAGDAVEALIRLGEQRPEAERRVLRTIERHKGQELPVERLIALVFAGG
ncbi:MAG TPA: Holliday junction branch migration protein RuvA [Phycisphaerales bacterium]|nr:Holliday junction branch migration protein RuvA [Phycisphaerales bacterium]